jgi:hypothetical protein
MLVYYSGNGGKQNLLLHASLNKSLILLFQDSAQFWQDLNFMN